LSGEAIGKFQFPILMLTGETSPGRYGQMFRAMWDCLPGSVGEPTVIANAAHGMHRDNPQAFNAAVLGFLSGRRLAEAFPFLAAQSKKLEFSGMSAISG
jgi:pimeloyl-ACP methyl ester carboxylesterase